jgi:UDP-N-acetylglucosamine 4,6-dehydratase/5-epimerase
MNWKDKIVLLTGGTGSFGQKFTEIMLKKYGPKTIRIFSRDELKQWEMEKKFNNDRRLRFFIGDIRDKDRVERAMDGVNIVVHTAALKQVPLCEYNPFEAVKTNIIGAQNIIEAAIDHNVEKVMAISTDKAVNPVNLYGASKMCMEKLFISAYSYVGPLRQTRMACVRYGNVAGSRGSVVPLFKKQNADNVITITDNRMTRFWLTLEEGAEFVIKCAGTMRGGEIFVPKIPSMKIVDLAKAIAPHCKIELIGIRPGEKIHESLITEDEARHASEFEGFFVIEPESPYWNKEKLEGGRPLPENFRYSSDENNNWLTIEDLRKIAENL